MTMTCSSIILCAIALVVLTTTTTIVEAHDKEDRPILDHSCSETKRPKEDQALRHAGLNALQYAINQYSYIGQGTADVNCVTDPADTVYGYTSSVRCTSYSDGHLSSTDCYNCLYNAQYRLVDKVCPESAGGQIKLKDCYMAYYAYGSPCLDAK